MDMRLLALATVSALTVTACAGIGDRAAKPDESTTTEPIPATTTTDATIPANLDGPSALYDISNPGPPTPLVDPEAIISGGPPPDGIPPIDSPQFVSVSEADEWLDDQEGVVYLTVGTETHAYPVQILIWHEVVNDVVAGVPVSVTYCPLCNSAVSYERTIGVHVTTFGTSGRLYASALVMYDRLTESLWTHYDGRAVAGVLTGHELVRIPSPLLAWSDLKQSFPDALVLDRDATGHNRRYGSNPYVGYDDPDGFPFLFNGTADDRARAMQRVVGVELDGESTAWPLDSISGGSAKATHGFVGDVEVVIFWKSGQVSAVEGGGVGSGRDVGSVGVYSPFVAGSALTFVARGDGFLDLETDTTWDITGRAIEGALQGSILEQVHHFDTFWFAWATYRPNTVLVEG